MESCTLDSPHLSGNPRLGARSMIAESALQPQGLEVTEKREAIVTVKTAGSYSSRCADHQAGADVYEIASGQTCGVFVATAPHP